MPAAVPHLQDVSELRNLSSQKPKRIPKVVGFTRRFKTRAPIVVGLSDEILERWLNGTLTLSLSKEYQTTREVVEYLIWREVAPMIRAARTAVGIVVLAMAGLVGVEAWQAAVGHSEFEIVRVRRGRRRGVRDGYQPLQVRFSPGVAA